MWVSTPRSSQLAAKLSQSRSPASSNIRLISGARTKTKPPSLIAPAIGVSKLFIGLFSISVPFRAVMHRCLDRLPSLGPALAKPEDAGAGAPPFAVPRPGPAFGIGSVARQSRAESGDKHRAHPIRTPRNRIGLGVDQEWLTQIIPSERDLLRAGLHSLRPVITGVAGFGELRVGHRNRQIPKVGVDGAQHRGLQPTSHCDVVRVDSPPAFGELAFQIQDAAGPAWRGE